LAVHVGALYAAIALKPHLFGADGAKEDAIEVTLVEAEALESVAAPVAGAAASPATAAATDGDAPVSVTPSSAAAALPVDVPPVREVPSEIVTASLPPLRMPTEPPIIDVRPLVVSAPEQPPQAAGGASARSVVVAPSTEAIAGAPPGVINAYRLAVASALARTKPPQGRGQGGTARVVFTIGTSGVVEAVEVQATSGDGVQDQMAIAAVRGTRFPAPDPLLSPAQRTFPISYRFLAAQR
jgi:TonB family protein